MTQTPSAQHALSQAIYLRSRGESARARDQIHEAERMVAETDVELRIRIAVERAILELLTGSPQRALTALNWVLAEANSERIDDLLDESPELDWHIARSFIINIIV